MFINQLSRHFFGVIMLAGTLISSGALAQPLQGQQDFYSQQQQLAGSWLTTYDVPAFVIPIPVLLTFTADGSIIETDSPAPTPFGGSIGTLFLSNGHGSWKQTGENQFAYTYRKILYAANGNPFGLARTNGAVTLSKDGTQLHANVDIRFIDNNGNVIFSATGTVIGNKIPVEQN
jgi:hypothetical protein